MHVAPNTPKHFKMSENQEVVLRAYRHEDRVELRQLWLLAFPDDPPHNAPDAMIDTKVKVQDDLLVVATRGNRLVGAVMAGFDGVRGWVYHLAVLPEHRRFGIGTKLMRFVERALHDLGCPKINLQVRLANHEVVAFYARLGYCIEDRVSMGRRLPVDAETIDAAPPIDTAAQ